MNHRDVEQLSSYLDGGLSPSDSARLKTRLASDPALASTLDALRESRTLLRRLPHRRAPRNFMLTPKMVGQKPPLPRSYPVFRFATVVATLLFGLSFLNIRPIAFGASAPAPAAYGIGGGGPQDMPATEAPMLESVPAATQPLAEPTTLQAALLLPTATPEPTADQNRAMEQPASPKSATEPPLAPAPVPFPLTPWQVGFGVIALLGAASMFLIQRLAARKWRAR
jgi:anti-sigma factor RsiW